jgi:hypothetical protein
MGVQRTLELALWVQKSELQIVVVLVQELTLMVPMRQHSRTVEQELLVTVAQSTTARYLSAMLVLVLEPIDWQEPADFLAMV